MTRKGNYLRSWGRGFFGNPHDIRADKENNIWCIANGDNLAYRFTRHGKLLLTLAVKGKTGSDDKTFDKLTDIAWAANPKMARTILCWLDHEDRCLDWQGYWARWKGNQGVAQQPGEGAAVILAMISLDG